MSLVLEQAGRPQESTVGALELGDRQIAEAAADCLRTSPYFPLRIVRCECNHGVLTLAGRVPSFYHRQMAHAHVRSIAGVSQIVDELQVP